MYSQAKVHATNVRTLTEDIPVEDKQTLYKEATQEVVELEDIVADSKAEVIKLEKAADTTPRQLSDAQAKLKNAQDNYLAAKTHQNNIGFNFDKYVAEQVKKKKKADEFLKGYDPNYNNEYYEADDNIPSEIKDAAAGDILYRIGAVNLGTVKFTEAAPLLKDMQAKTKKNGY